MEKLKVSQVARELGISPTAIYKKFRTSSELFQNHITKEKGVTYLTREGVEALKASLQTSPREGLSHGSEPVQNQVQSLEKRVSEQQEVILGLQKTLDTLLSNHAEERARADTIIMGLSRDVGSLRKALEDKRPAPSPVPVSPRSVEAPQPEAPIKGTEGLGFLQRVWVELFEPERLRRFPA